MTRRVPVVLLAVLASVAAAALYGSLVRLPHLFAWSDAVLLGAGAGALCLALVITMPDAWLHAPADRIRYAFRQRHRIGDGRAESALKAITALHDQALRLRRAAPRLGEPARARIASLQAHLDAAAADLMETPDRIGDLRAIAVRAEGVIDAVETLVALRRTKAAHPRLDEARSHVLGALDALEVALGETEARRVGTLLDDIEVASATARALLGARKPSPKGALP